MTDTPPSNGSQEPSDPKISARLALILASVPVILALFSALRDLFDWKLPWSPLAGWILVGLAFLAVGAILLSRKSVRAFLGKWIKDRRTWIGVRCALFLALTIMVIWLGFRVGRLNAVLLEQGADLTDSLATAAAHATDIAYLESTVSSLGPTLVFVSPDATTPVPTGSTVAPTATITPAPADSTTEKTVAPMTQSTPSATSRATSTPTPSPGTPVPSPTPGPIVAVITTKGGDAEIELTEFKLLYESDLNGFPIQTGVEVDWDYVDKVEIRNPGDSSEIPVTITLVNSEALEAQIGWKGTAFGGHIRLQGKSAVADVDTFLEDVPMIDYRWSDAQTQIPDGPPASDKGPAATVVTKAGATIDVTGLRFFCSDSFYCRPSESSAVPLSSGIRPLLTKVKEMTFGEADGAIPVTVILADGNGQIEDTLYYEWRLVGFAALGEFDLLASQVATVTIRD